MKTISITDRIKIGAAILLLICILLPLKSCTRCIDEDGTPTYISKKPAVQSVTTYTYAWEEFDVTDISGWLFILCFIWPIPILIHRYKSRRDRVKFFFWLLEPLCIGGASFYTYFLSTLLASPSIGAYLMHTAYFFFGICWVSEAAIKIINRGRQRSP